VIPDLSDVFVAVLTIAMWEWIKAVVRAVAQAQRDFQLRRKSLRFPCGEEAPAGNPHAPAGAEIGEA
jgi:hypothetical protein